MPHQEDSTGPFDRSHVKHHFMIRILPSLSEARRATPGAALTYSIVSNLGGLVNLNLAKIVLDSLAPVPGGRSVASVSPSLAFTRRDGSQAQPKASYGTVTLSVWQGPTTPVPSLLRQRRAATVPVLAVIVALMTLAAT